MTLAGWRLSLDPMILPWRRKARLAPGSILDPRYGVVPFQNRPELHDLIAWCLAPESADDPIRLYSAPGGMGKTRLLIQACADLREKHDWTAGFLAEAARQEAAQLAETSHPTLIVVDYAESKIATVAALIEALHPHWLAGERLRLVLLSRDGPAPVSSSGRRSQVPWIEALRQRSGAATQERVSLLDATPLAHLAETATDRRASFTEAQESFADALFGGEQIAARLAAAAPAPDLSDDTFRRILFIHAAALASLEGLTLSTATQLLDYLVDREERTWQLALDSLRLGGRITIALVGQVAALLTLHGGADDPVTAHTIVDRAPLAEGQTRADLERVGDVLRQLYPGSRYVEPVQPDLIGEHIIERQLDRDSTLLDLALLRDAQPVVAFEILRRLSDRRPATLRWLASAAESLSKRFGSAANEEEAARLAFGLLPLLPSETVALLEFRYRVEVVCLNALPEGSPTGLRAALLNNFADTLRNLGQREDALAAAQEAVELCRDLARAWPDAFRPDLAASLNNFANSLSDLGRHEEALAAAQEAVELRRDLARARPDAFRPDLAASLNNLANSLSDLGRHEEALAAAQEVVELRRDLVRARPDNFRPGLAMALNNLANRLRDLGQREEAVAAAREAIGFYRDLVRARPDEVRPDLAMAVNTFAVVLIDSGRREEALAAAQEAVGLYRNLAQVRPDAFKHYLAGSLNTFAKVLSDLGRHEDALAAAQKAAGLHRSLAEAWPDIFGPGLAISLNNLAVLLSDLGRREEALVAAQKAVGLYRDLARARPSAFRPGLAGSLDTLAYSLGNVGRHKEALIATQEAVGLYRNLAQARPDVFRPDLALAIETLAYWQDQVGDTQAALTSAMEAILLLTPVFLQHPQAVSHWIVPLCQKYIERCKRLGLGPDSALLAPINETLKKLQRPGA